jgi:hypothetical protein
LAGCALHPEMPKARPFRRSAVELMIMATDSAFYA